ncbi:aspartate/glutamate racemase family protein [Pseudomonas sp. Marseille-Q5115]|uniref:aspartate/glutamate racemase family protein n=1 Tax=Pseudomonas sp. Marseille-Q5115 TaxID=2866593 RepID=UPI001CE3B5C9|nr:aspartate/glutamate racemase family protein [Pseudomonas sp. Marseille-Q5115]
MRTLGVIGGMSWESTATYYRLLNEGVRDRLGGLHSAPLLLHSVDFAQVAAMQKAGEWEAAGELLERAAQGLERAGATALLLATNTMHKVAGAIEASVDIPLLHIGDAVGQQLQAQGIERVALLGTRFTMREPFYRDRLSERFGQHVLLPTEAEMEEIDRVIFSELCVGAIKPEAKAFYLACLERLQANGAQAAILGCTEIGLLIGPDDTALTLVDSTEAHVGMGLEWMVGRFAG